MKTRMTTTLALVLTAASGLSLANPNSAGTPGSQPHYTNQAHGEIPNLIELPQRHLNAKEVSQQVYAHPDSGSAGNVAQNSDYPTLRTYTGNH